MRASTDPRMRASADQATLAPALDQTTVRALCDAGYVSSRDYLELASANGWQPDPFIRARLARLAPPIPPRDGAPAGLDPRYGEP